MEVFAGNIVADSSSSWTHQLQAPRDETSFASGLSGHFTLP